MRFVSEFKVQTIKRTRTRARTQGLRKNFGAKMDDDTKKPELEVEGREEERERRCQWRGGRN